MPPPDAFGSAYTDVSIHKTTDTRICRVDILLSTMNNIRRRMLI